MTFDELRRKAIFEAFDKFPDHGDRTIASYLWQNYPEYWNSYETVRGIVRRYRGHNGDFQRTYLKNTKYVKPLQITRIIRDEV